MSQHRVHCSLDSLLALRHQGEGLRLRLQPRLLERMAGGHVSRLRGRGMEFAEHREYQAGDDLRAIDWRVTARRSRPYTRLYQEELERPVFLVVDQRKSLFFGSRHRFKSVLAAEAAALLLWAGLAQQDRVGGVVLGADRIDICPPRRQTRHALRFLESLAQANAALSRSSPVGNPQALVTVLEEVRRLARPGSLCVLISDWRYLDEAILTRLRALNGHLQTVALQVFDPLERELPRGLWHMTDGQQRLTLALRTPEDQHPINRALQSAQARIAPLLLQAGTPCLSLSTWDDPHHELTRLGLGR